MVAADSWSCAQSATQIRRHNQHMSTRAVESRGRLRCQRLCLSANFFGQHSAFDVLLVVFQFRLQISLPFRPVRNAGAIFRTSPSCAREKTHIPTGGYVGGYDGESSTSLGRGHRGVPSYWIHCRVLSAQASVTGPQRSSAKLPYSLEIHQLSCVQRLPADDSTPGVHTDTSRSIVMYVWMNKPNIVPELVIRINKPRLDFRRLSR